MGYEIDIHRLPDFGLRPISRYIIHTDPSSRDYVDNMICFHSGKYPQTFAGAQEMSRHWTEMIHKYIQTTEPSMIEPNMECAPFALNVNDCANIANLGCSWNNGKNRCSGHSCYGKNAQTCQNSENSQCCVFYPNFGN